MNRRGVLLTLMVFFVGIVAVTLAINSANIQKQREATYPQTISQSSVNNQFEQGYFTIQNLYASGQVARDKSRGFLFRYDFNANTIALTQSLPIPSKYFDQFNETLNIYPIFWNQMIDKNFLQTNFSFFSLQNSLWGGATRFPVYEYVILPQCVVYQLDYNSQNLHPLRILKIEKGVFSKNRCIFERQLFPDQTPDFLKNWYAIQKISVNVYSSSLASGLPVCTGSLNQGNGNCWRRPFDPNRAWPFAELHFFVGNDKNFSVYNHFDPGQLNKISFDINGTDKNVVFGGNQIAVIDLSGLSPTVVTRADINLVFRFAPQEFLLNNYSLLVEQSAFNVRRLSQTANAEPFCGDFDCNATYQETIATCPADCTCGNGLCEPWENPSTCPGDCALGNGFCSEGEIGTDCLGACGNARCDQNEFFASCNPNECNWCANGTCDTGENISNCPQDCTSGCMDECTPSGATQCAGSTAYQVCGNNDADSCLEWGIAATCPVGQTCVNGTCTSSTQAD